MTPEERQMLSGLFERIRGQANSPRDPDAEAFIAEAVRGQPYAPYLLAQAVLVQEHALTAATDQISTLQAKVASLEAARSEPQPAGGGSFLSGIGRTIFGGSQPPPASPPRGAVPSYAPPQPDYAPPPGYTPQSAPGPWAQPAPSGGGSFLKGALGAAAGVAGGVLLADSIRGLLSGHSTFGTSPGLFSTDSGVLPSEPHAYDAQDVADGGVADDDSDDRSGSDYAGSDFGNDGSIDV